MAQEHDVGADASLEEGEGVEDFLLLVLGDGLQDGLLPAEEGRGVREVYAVGGELSSFR